MRNETLSRQEIQTLSPFQARRTAVATVTDLVVTVAITAALGLSAVALNANQVQVSQAVQDSQEIVNSYDMNLLIADEGDNWTGG